MANVTWRRSGELLHALFEALHQHPEGLPAVEAIRAVEHRLGLTPHEAGQYADGTRRFERGYHVGWVAPPGKDAAVDIVAFNDPLGTQPPRIKVQVKRQQNKVAVDGLRSFMATLGAEDVGIFVSAGGFTRDAEDEARGQHARRVTLVDLERLVDLWTEHHFKRAESARRRLPLEPIYFPLATGIGREFELLGFYRSCS